jgi:hypothetical protein
MLIERLTDIGADYQDPCRHDREVRDLLHAFGYLVEIWDGLDLPRTQYPGAKVHFLLRAA